MLREKKYVLRFAAVLCCFIMALACASCSSSSSPSDPNGQVRVTMVDAPADYDQVNIVITSVAVHQAGADANSGWIVINNASSTYNMLMLRNGESAVVGNGSLAAGHYTQIRLMVGSGCNVVVGGAPFSLDVSAQAQTGIIINQEFDVQAGGTCELLLDFNVNQSIMVMGMSQFKLFPMIRHAPASGCGTISGKIAPLLSVSAVTVLSGSDTVTSTIPDKSSGAFKLMALVQGTYTVKLTGSNAAFTDTTIANVSVSARQNTDLGIITMRPK